MLLPSCYNTIKMKMNELQLYATWTNLKCNTEDLKPGAKGYILNEQIHFHEVPRQVKLHRRARSQGSGYLRGGGWAPEGSPWLLSYSTSRSRWCYPGVSTFCNLLHGTIMVCVILFQITGVLPYLRFHFQWFQLPAVNGTVQKYYM